MIPLELEGLKQWVLWRYVDKGGDKPSKVPVAADGSFAAVDNPQTWLTSSEALLIKDKLDGDADGIGFVFTNNDDFFGVDIDNCIDSETEQIKPWAQSIIDDLPTYWEVSPSGKGVKAFCRGQLPLGFKNRAPVEDGCLEIYYARRYFTLTGDHVEGTPRNVRQVEILGTLEKFMPRRDLPQGIAPLSEQPSDEYKSQAFDMLRKIPESISGKNGHGSLLRAACECVRFNLDDVTAMDLLRWFNANKCQPSWEHSHLERKWREAKRISEHERGIATLFNATIEQPESLVPLDFGDVESVVKKAPGLIGAITDWILDTSTFQHPQLALGAAIATTATVIGRKVCDKANTRSNVYVIGIGESSSGKNHPFQAPRLLLESAGLDNLVGPTNFGSRLSFTRHLENEPSQLFRVDEADVLFRSFQADPVMQGLAEDLKSVWSEAANENYKGSAFVDVSKTIKINQPNPCLYCTATPAAFYASITGVDVEAGLIGRFICLNSDGYPEENDDCKYGADARIPPMISEHLRHLHGMPVIANGLLGHWSDFIAEQTPAAAAILAGYAKAVREKMRQKVADNPAGIAAIGKAPEIASKLAMIAGASNGTDGVIDEDVASWAVAVAKVSTHNISEALEAHTAATKFEQHVKKLRHKGRLMGTMTRTQITRLLRVDAQTRDDVISHLTDARECAVDQSTPAKPGRPSTVYRFR